MTVLKEWTRDRGFLREVAVPIGALVVFFAVLAWLTGCATTGGNVMQRPQSPPVQADVLDIHATGRGIDAAHGAIGTRAVAPTAWPAAEPCDAPHPWAITWPDGNAVTRSMIVGRLNPAVTSDAVDIVRVSDPIADRLEPTCYHNPTGEKFHRDKSCRFVGPAAEALPCDAAAARWKPCRTCGGGG